MPIPHRPSADGDPDGSPDAAATPIEDRMVRQHRFLTEPRTLDSAQRRKGEALSHQERFTRLIAHEFRNPLAIIKSQAQVAQREATELASAPATKKAQQRQRTIQRAVERLEMLLDQWLVANRLALGNLDVHPATLTLGPWLSALIQSRGAAAGRPISLEIPPSAAAAKIDGDLQLLSTAVLQLLDNALKYSPRDGAIQVGVFLTDQEAGIRVTDTGIGIAPQDQELIFDRSLRLNPETSLPGMGLGLPLARDIAQLHGGRIEVVSTPGQGSTFTLWLPLAP